METVAGAQGQTTLASQQLRRYTTAVRQKEIRCVDCYIVNMINLS